MTVCPTCSHSCTAPMCSSVQNSKAMSAHYKDCGLARTYLAAVPSVTRLKCPFANDPPVTLLFTLEVGSRILATVANEQSPGLADRHLVISRPAVLAVLVLMSEPIHPYLLLPGMLAAALPARLHWPAHQQARSLVNEPGGRGIRLMSRQKISFSDHQNGTSPHGMHQTAKMTWRSQSKGEGVLRPFRNPDAPFLSAVQCAGLMRLVDRSAGSAFCLQTHIPATRSIPFGRKHIRHHGSTSNVHSRLGPQGTTCGACCTRSGTPQRALRGPPSPTSTQGEAVILEIISCTGCCGRRPVEQVHLDEKDRLPQ